MPKQIITDTFETLGGMVKSTGQQAVADVKKAGEDVAIELGLKPVQQQSQGDQTPAPTAAEAQEKKMGEAANKRATARYQEIQAEIKALEDKRKKELPKEVTGKPGFDEEKAVKQLEVGGAASAEASASQREKLPPLPVRQASQKTETFRGTSG